MATEQTIYAFAHVEAWLEQYAKQSRLNAAELIADVAGLLKPNGVQVSSGVQKPNGVRRKPGISAYWSKMTKEERSKEIKRRQKIARSKYPAGGVA